MQLHQVEIVSVQASQTPLDALLQEAWTPIEQLYSGCMTALGEEVVLLAAVANGSSNQFFTLPVAFGSINDVEPSIQSFSKQAADFFDAGSACLAAHLITAKAEPAHLHVGLAKGTCFHLVVSSQNMRTSVVLLSYRCAQAA